MERREAFRFHTPSSLLVVGPSGCGKTVFTANLLLNNLELFHTRPPPPPNTLLLRGVARWVSTYERTGDQVSRRRSRHRSVENVVSLRRTPRVGRSHG